MSTHQTPNPALLHPPFPPKNSPPNKTNSPDCEPPAIQTLIAHLNLTAHIEGGYFAETDRDPNPIPNPFTTTTDRNSGAITSYRPASSSGDSLGQIAATRSASTSILYLLTPRSPLSALHRNRGRTVLNLLRGRARYVVLHADEVAAEGFSGGYGGSNRENSGSATGSSSEEERRWKGKARVEIFTVGADVARGERVQWVVEGGKYKGVFLLPDCEGGEESAEGVLVSETVVPGFEYEDHDFLTRERFEVLVPDELKGDLEWMVRKA